MKTRKHYVLKAIEQLSDALEDAGLGGAVVLLNGPGDGQRLLDMIEAAGYGDVADSVSSGELRDGVWRHMGDDILRIAWPAECEYTTGSLQ